MNYVINNSDFDNKFVCVYQGSMIGVIIILFYFHHGMSLCEYNDKYYNNCRKIVLNHFFVNQIKITTSNFMHKDQ